MILHSFPAWILSAWVFLEQLKVIDWKKEDNMVKISSQIKLNEPSPFHYTPYIANVLHQDTGEPAMDRWLVNGELPPSHTHTLQPYMGIRDILSYLLF